MKQLLHESYLEPITNEERDKMIPVLIKYLKENSSPTKQIVDGEIVKAMIYFGDCEGRFKGKFNSTRLRKLVNWCRGMAVAPIISTDKGYYISDDPDELKTMWESFHSRIRSQMWALDGIRKMYYEMANDRDELGFDWNEVVKKEEELDMSNPDNWPEYK